MDQTVSSDRMTDRARGVITSAEQIAYERGAATVQPEHILLALVREPVGVAGHVLRSLEISAANVENSLPAAVAQFPAQAMPLSLSEDSLHAIEVAGAEAARLWHNYIGTEHLVIGVANDPSVRAMLEKIGLTPTVILRNVHEILGH
jgi:ATP-dependent Clp protease ATP-binding subunit ClpC